MKSISTSKKWKLLKLNPIKLSGGEEREHKIKYLEILLFEMRRFSSISQLSFGDISQQLLTRRH